MARCDDCQKVFHPWDGAFMPWRDLNVAVRLLESEGAIEPATAEYLGNLLMDIKGAVTEYDERWYHDHEIRKEDQETGAIAPENTR